MDTIKYKDIEVIPIMKPMLVWDGDEDSAVEKFVIAKVTQSVYPFKTLAAVGPDWEIGGGWKNAKPLPEIEINVKINGVEAKLSDISEETLLKLRKL